MIRLINIGRFPLYREDTYSPRLPADRLRLPIGVIVEWKREQAWRANVERLERRLDDGLL